MNEYWIWTIIVVAAAVAVPLIARAIRKKDFMDQVKGEKPEREWKNRHYYLDKDSPNKEMERLKREMEQKTKDNYTGLHG